jgi:hypothetical protein
MRDPSTTHGRAITSFYVARRQCVKSRAKQELRVATSTNGPAVCDRQTDRQTDRQNSTARNRVRVGAWLSDWVFRAFSDRNWENAPVSPVMSVRLSAAAKLRKVQWIFIRYGDSECHWNVGNTVMQVCAMTMEDVFTSTHLRVREARQSRLNLQICLKIENELTQSL